MDNWISQAHDNAAAWLSSQVVDAGTRATVEGLLGDQDKRELVARFYKKLDFGTGGLRAVMGVGSTCINQYTIGIATQGLSHYLKKSFPHTGIKAVIAYDSRHQSKEFATITSQVLSANGIFVYLFPELRPTPLLSFAVRHLGCHAGIVITASHNPKEYNGYKVYGQDGAQLLSPHDKNMIKEVNALSQLDQINFRGDSLKIKSLGTAVEEAYFARAQKLFPDSATIQRQSNLPIVYSSLHGTGITMVTKLLDKIGFRNCIVVKTQEEPDGNFPTVVSPNPEEPAAMAQALAVAKQTNAELIMATDPDADRVGFGIKAKSGNFILLNGNQALSLLAWFALKNQKTTNGGYIVKTIVTTDLVDAIAKRWGVDCYNTLTGFKYIAAQIAKWEGKKTFIAAGEESYGFLLGDFVRDKDAIAACAFFAYMAAVAKDKGETLYQWLIQLYIDYGLYQEALADVVNTGPNGAVQMQKKMEKLRTVPPVYIDKEKVTRIVDFKLGEDRNLTTGHSKPTVLPQSDVLQFYTDGGSKVSIRPSGTEPKIKFYISVQGQLNHHADYIPAVKQLNQKIKRIKKELLS